MKSVRTPESRFSNLPGYPFTPNYIETNRDTGDSVLRMHYVDEGPSDGEVVLMLHGEPSWSYLYRHMIPVFTGAGYRAIAPDLIGFGRSDKPLHQNDYSFARHVGWMADFLEQLNLNQVTLVCQDWGSLIGLRVAAENEQRFSRIVLANGGLPTGDQELPAAFKAWQRFARFSPWFPIGRIVAKGCRNEISPAIRAAYDAPFPGRKYKAGSRAFPTLVPTRPDDPASDANRNAWRVFEQWTKPFMTAFSNKDPITRGGERPWQSRVPGAREIQHVTIEDAGHFLQEDKGEELANQVIRFMQAS